NHNPVDSAWSLTRRPGVLTLDTLQAPTFVKARNTLSQKLMGFAGTYTVKLDASEMADGQFAGLACMGRVNYQAGVLMEDGVRHLCLASDAGESARIELPGGEVWLRLSFDIPDNAFRFWYSTDGRRFSPWGEVFPAQFGFWKGARPALFSFNRNAAAGTARFDDFVYVRQK
ncbi:MAG: beta-xylosidase, partial [Bacteroidales bacterium]|nr:beta-xylosidase [Bacteroidales bacterium]